MKKKKKQVKLSSSLELTLRKKHISRQFATSELRLAPKRVLELVESADHANCVSNNGLLSVFLHVMSGKSPYHNACMYMASLLCAYVHVAYSLMTF